MISRVLDAHSPTVSLLPEAYVTPSPRESVSSSGGKANYACILIESSERSLTQCIQRLGHAWQNASTSSAGIRLPLRFSDIDLLPTVRRDIHLLRIIDRDRG